MSETKQNVILLKLAYPTAFPDKNRKEERDSGELSTEIHVQRMKHKHFRKMQSMTEEKQIHYVMRELTGLSDNDLDELDAEDSAKLSEIIFNFMRHYAEIARKMMA